MAENDLKKAIYIFWNTRFERSGISCPSIKTKKQWLSATPETVTEIDWEFARPSEVTLARNIKKSVDFFRKQI